MESDYFSVHTHSEFSIMDGMDTVQSMVDRVVELGQPGLALTDHGVMGGTVQAYKAAKKAGIAFYPGTEAYVVRNVNDPATRGDRWHLGLMALDQKGYKALSDLSTLSWSEGHFYRKPLIDMADLAFLYDEGYADHIAVTTGCYFGLVINEWKEGRAHASRMIDMLARWFPNLYVEMQDHGITQPNGMTDNQIAMELYDLAQAKGLPVVMGGDSHYTHPHQQAAHDLMKSICYHGNDEDTKFPGGPYALLDSTTAASCWKPEVWDAIEDGHADLLDKHALTLPALDNYKFHVPAMFRNADTELRDRVYDGLEALGILDKPHEDRAKTELHTITTMGMSNYFLLVQEHVATWCRDNDIIVTARGSVNGCLVAYALGITNVDPVVWSTSFDRFLSLDRMKPPDIDIDVDFRGRRRLIEHVRSVFPSVVQIGTFSKIGVTEREGDDGTGEDKGSAVVQYMSAMRRKKPDFDGRIAPEDRAPLNALVDIPVNKSFGVNAAGFVLPAADLPIDAYLPLMRVASSKTVVTQFSKDDVEALGYMKLDILGIRALQTLNGTLTRIGRQPNEWNWIPFDCPDACKLLRSGNGTGIFQFEGWSTANGGKEMKIKSTLDVVICLALYRPALKNQKDLYLHNRGKARARQERLHPIFDPVLKDTAGVVLFQEQVMEILKTIGMGFQDWNALMTAVKASNGNIAGAAQTFERIEPIFYDLCEDKGFTDDEADDAWMAVVGYTEYGFNRAHATGYALSSYYGAYLKSHYPLEYMASLMDTWAGDKDKEREYVAECRNLGFSIVKADVNYSGASWEIDPTKRNALRKGLVSLPGIGWNVAEAVVEARKAGPFASMQDFMDRTPRRPVTGGADYKRTGDLKGVCKTLYEAGAFRSLNP